MPSDKDLEQAGFFANRLLKRDRHLRKWARRTDTNCYRVYDRDIPELPLSLDRYGDAAVLYLYERPYDKPEAEERAWLELMAEAASAALDIDPGSVAVKTRRRLGVDRQYGKSDDDDGSYVRPGSSSGPGELVVKENGLSFIVNTRDYIDTGLFMDHRPARQMIRSRSDGMRVLNLFCYTGSFSVYALAGGASETVGVDLSSTYLAWAERNIAVNGLDAGRYRGVRADASAFPSEAASRGERFDLIILDPPTFSNSKRMDGYLDTARHWPGLVSGCLAALAPDGVILFSTNARGLRFDASQVPGAAADDISDSTVPEDFRGHPHRTWLVRHA